MNAGFGARFLPAAFFAGRFAADLFVAFLATFLADFLAAGRLDFFAAERRAGFRFALPRLADLFIAAIAISESDLSVHVTHHRVTSENDVGVEQVIHSL
jgi:predicted nucleic acid-binding protein